MNENVYVDMLELIGAVALAAFIVLIFLSIVIWALREVDVWIGKKLEKRQARLAKLATTAGTNADICNQALSPDSEKQKKDTRLLAVLTAAVSATISSPFRIERISFLNQASDNWAGNGRYSLMSSHSITTQKENKNGQ